MWTVVQEASMQSGRRPVSSPNGTAAALLGFLHEGPMTGWELFTTSQQRIGSFWPLPRSQVYRELAAMASLGLVESLAVGPRNRRPYALTRAGREAFAEWIDVEPGHESIRFPLLLTVVFAAHLKPGRLVEFVQQHRERHAEQLAVLVAQEAEAAPERARDPSELAVLEFGLAYERAVVAWLDQPLSGLPAPPAPTFWDQPWLS